MSEDRIQQDCYMWFHNTYPTLRGLLFHVPNGGNRDAREGMKFKQVGVVSGVADLFLLYKGKTYLLELKTEKGRQSQNQLNWQRTVESQDFNYFIIRSLEEFKEIIKPILSK